MNLHAKRVTADFEDLESLDRVNREAFPPEERIELNRLLMMAEANRVEFAAIYDGETFIGFYVLRIQVPIVYMYYLAIDRSKRSRGYGGQALKLLEELYPDCQIVLDLEKLDEDAENYEQRKARKLFYLHNGYYETGYYMSYLGMTFEVLCNSSSFDKESFQALLDELTNRHFQPRLFPK